MRVLVVTNMRPDESAPQRGSFVREQAAAMRGLGAEVELFDFAPGPRSFPGAVARLRARLRGQRFDVVHAHFGLAGWCARLAGADPLVVTFHGTDVRHPRTGALSRRLVGRLALTAVASRALFEPEGGRPGLPRAGLATAVLPCGADLSRLHPQPRAEARRRLGLDEGGRYLLFPADPAREVKRADRAQELARLAQAELLTAGGIEPERMVDWINASNAVLITSDNEGFGLAAAEALACDVPVLSTPVGVVPFLLSGLEGCLSAPFDPRAWAPLARAHLDAADPRVEGRARAEALSAERMAERVLAAYRGVLARRGPAIDHPAA